MSTKSSGSSSSSCNNNNNNAVSTLISVAATAGGAVVVGVLPSLLYYYYFYYYHYHSKSQQEKIQQEEKDRRRFKSSQWHNQEEQEFGHDTLPSIIEHFKDFSLSKTATVKEANQRRTLSYYLKARQAHEQSLVLGQSDYPKLMDLRKQEMDTILRYYHQGTKSHRTVIVMLDHLSQQLLHEARKHILAPLLYSHDITTRGVWIPETNMIPPCDMHVTVAIPWWWHTMLPENNKNYQLSQALANRFRQALVYDFHHPFQLELERIILLGGKTLVALWRTIGERLVVEDANHVIQDRHGTGIDPFVRLRREIVQCFTTENEDIQRKPLTYHAHKQSLMDQQEALLQNVFADGGEDKKEDEKRDGLLLLEGGFHPLKRAQSLPVRPTQQPPPPPIPPRPPLVRQPTIEFKTPGMGDGDGFIHTTLCRLPLDCLSTTDVELEPIHRLCREATAMYAGHRMIVHRFRFLETTGQGGDSNPCVAPIFDETMEAPTRVTVDACSGHLTMVGSHHATNPIVYVGGGGGGGGGGAGAGGGGSTTTMDGGAAGGDYQSHDGSGSGSGAGVVVTGSSPSLHPIMLRRVESRHATIGALPTMGLSMTQNPPVLSLFDDPAASSSEEGGAGR